ncbi:HlyD family type I secretion periplasmic adaptor subunit [Martelella mediterranea]|uniref:Membrane fusion protein (MFP) family protein n=1 Tax=Martelella mediterranea TaxID=293089 RepID=A0A4R3NK86_9HYPH|nr:HlyD family type I secretion periplasmic adaptor subunit [Martelella mediterranea]TCT34760.1 adhesin transport system membrane fusion protein [Martelella mediterranea]
MAVKRGKLADPVAPAGFERETEGVRRRHRTVLWLFAVCLVIGVGWASFASLEEVTRGSGKVIPLSRGQIIQSLEGGIIERIDVQEGQEVDAGEVLAVLDDTTVRAEYNDLVAQTVGLRASLARLRAEMEGRDAIRFPDDVRTHEEVTAIEQALFDARRRNFVETTQSLEERIALATQQSDLAGKMVSRQAMSIVEGLRIDQELADMRGKLAEVRNTYYQEISDEIARRNTELQSLLQRLAQKQDTLTRTDLRSPVRGIVKNLNVTTKGAVVRPGEKIMEIVPLDDKLFVEARIKPRDVAFLHTGQTANVKITAYDYTTYGSLEGELVFISADTIIDENQRDPEPFYRVRVLTDRAYLEGPQGALPIKPGMVAEVDILTGKRTVLAYLMKPILRGQEALLER